MKLGEQILNFLVSISLKTFITARTLKKAEYKNLRSNKVINEHTNPQDRKS
jgi:hypothetical protein